MFTMFYFNKNGQDNFESLDPETKKLMCHYVSYDSFDMSIDDDMDIDQLNKNFNNQKIKDNENIALIKYTHPLDLKFTQLISELNNSTKKDDYKDLVNNIGFYSGGIQLKNSNELSVIIFETESYFPLKFKIILFDKENKKIDEISAMNAAEFYNAGGPIVSFDVKCNTINKNIVVDFYKCILETFSNVANPIIDISVYQTRAIANELGL